MAETGSAHRIRRDSMTRLGGKELRQRSADNHYLGGIVLGAMIPDDNLHDSVRTLVLPVVAECRDGSLVVPTARVSAELARIGQEQQNDDARWLAMQLGADPNAALVVPEERVYLREPL